MSQTDFPAGWDADRVANSEQHIQRRRLLVVLQLADVGPVDASREGELLLSQAGRLAGIA